MTTPDPTDRPTQPGPPPTDRVEHVMERTYEVPATPEQVWDAIATADGISSWMVPTRLDPRVGGAMSFDVGDLHLTGIVTGYTPNRRFAYEEAWPLGNDPDAIPAEMAEWFASIGIPLSDVAEGLSSVGPIATEYLVEGASGGSSVIRVVTSSYGAGAEWEHEFFGQMAADLIPLLDNLATHLGGHVRAVTEQGAER